MAWVHGELGALPDSGDNGIHMFEAKPGVDALAVEVHGHGHNIHVAGALAVAHQGALDPVRPRHNPKLSGGHRTAPVIVGMQRDAQGFTVGDVVTEPLDLVGIDVGRTHLHRRGEIDDHGAFHCGFQHRIHGITDLHGEVHFRASEALGAVFKDPFGLGVPVRLGLDQGGPLNRYVHNTAAVQPEHITSLHD